MKNYNAPLWVPLAILFAIGIAAFLLPATLDAIIRLGQMSGITDVWAGFAGSIIGAGITLIAALIAYAAVLQQTKSAERISVRREQEAHQVLREDLFLVLRLINIIWQTVDWALEPGISDGRRAYRATNAMTNFFLLPPRQQIDDYRKRSEKMLPIHASKFISISTWLDTCDDLRSNIDRGPQVNEPQSNFQNRIISTAQTAFTGLARAVDSFDPSLGTVFRDRVRSDRFALPMLDQLDALFDMHAAHERQIFKDDR